MTAAAGEQRRFYKDIMVHSKQFAYCPQPKKQKQAMLLFFVFVCQSAKFLMNQWMDLIETYQT